jgi:hypothetical protein
MESASQFVENLSLRRKTSFVAFRENLLPIDGDDEDAAAASNDLAVDPEFSFDLSRQTGGSGEVVSNPAVVDSNVHGYVVFTRIAVTLSRPPRALAVSINSLQAFSRSSAFSVTSFRISSSGTMPVRPSEQRR